MKAINASTARNRFVSLDLQERSGFSKFNRAAVKRGSRRQQRHELNDALRHDLIADVAEGIAAYKIAHRNVRTAPTLALGAIALSAPATATVIPFRQREITVIRKRQFHRAVIETLRLAA